MDILEEIAQNLIEGYADKVKRLTEQAIQEGNSPADVLDKGLLAGMNVVGARFKKNEMYLPEVLMCARAMKNGMSVLQPLLEKANIQSKGRIALGVVKGDIHDIGKNLVGIMLQGAGFDVLDLGTDVPTARFIECVQKEKPDVLGMSALLTTTMGRMKEVIDALDAGGIRNGVRVIIGGAPISKTYADEIRADGYARDAATAVDLVKSLMQDHPSGL